jgi:transcriptional regulator with XRE-family HTH domain
MEMIGQKIKELRLLKGLTQEELAERTNLNVRTIQRIESGEVDPRSYTLNLLADALGVELEEFTRETMPKSETSKQTVNKSQWLALLHLSGLLTFLFPPLIIYIFKKEEIPEMKTHFNDVFNFQLSMILYILISVVLVVIIIGVFLLIAIGIGSTVIIVLNSIRVLNGDPYKYPFTIKFLK